MKCYMCDNESTTEEHVPPACFFPPGQKVNLITVSSCTLHNLRKSKDDEYIRSIIAPSLGNNSFGLDMALTKVNRSFLHSKGLIAAVFKEANAVRTGDGRETVAITVNLNRWDEFFNHFSNAIYFHDFQTTHRKRWDIVTPSLKPDNSVLNGQLDPYREVNQKLSTMRFVEQKASNPKIFRYSLFRHSSESYAYKFVFYEGFVVCALSTPEESTFP